MHDRERDTALRDELVDMATEILRAKGTTADGGFHGSSTPDAREMHLRHNRRLAGIVDRYGWPGKHLVDEEGVDAAWIVLQQAVSDPALVRRCLPLLQRAAAEGEVPEKQAVLLLDRIRVLEGKPQVYGTQYDWDDAGRLNPLPVEDPAGVNERRKRAGLIPLEKDLELKRYALAQSSELPPKDIGAYRRQFEAWCKENGWR